VSATLIDSLDATSGDSEGDGLLEFGHIDALLLHIRVLTHLASWIELGSPSPVGVASTHN